MFQPIRDGRLKVSILVFVNRTIANNEGTFLQDFLIKTLRNATSVLQTDVFIKFEYLITHYGVLQFWQVKKGGPTGQFIIYLMLFYINSFSSTE